MVEIKHLTQDGKSATIYQVENGYFLVSFVDRDLFLDAGYFTTQEVAENKAVELFNAVGIWADMLVGDVAPE